MQRNISVSWRTGKIHSYLVAVFRARGRCSICGVTENKKHVFGDVWWARLLQCDWKQDACGLVLFETTSMLHQQDVWMLTLAVVSHLPCSRSQQTFPQQRHSPSLPLQRLHWMVTPHWSNRQKRNRFEFSALVLLSWFTGGWSTFNVTPARHVNAHPRGSFPSGVCVTPSSGVWFAESLIEQKNRQNVFGVVCYKSKNYKCKTCELTILTPRTSPQPSCFPPSCFPTSRFPPSRFERVHDQVRPLGCFERVVHLLHDQVHPGPRHPFYRRTCPRSWKRKNDISCFRFVLGIANCTCSTITQNRVYVRMV